MPKPPKDIRRQFELRLIQRWQQEKEERGGGRGEEPRRERSRWEGWVGGLVGSGLLRAAAQAGWAWLCAGWWALAQAQLTLWGLVFG